MCQIVTPHVLHPHWPTDRASPQSMLQVVSLRKIVSIQRGVITLLRLGKKFIDCSIVSVALAV